MKPYISVVVKPTLSCNESCSHCYHTPEERIPGVMPPETVDRLNEMVASEYQAAWFIWHGGEPLTVPMSFYKQAIESQERHFGKNSFRVGNTIQTNGTLLNRRLMAYCREKMINVGVSCEGPYNGVLRELDPEKAISMLSSKDNKYSVSATISRETALKQKEIYEFYRGRGTNVSFSPVIPAGCARCNGTVPDPDEFIRGSIEVFDEWMYDSEAKVPLIPHYLYILNYLGDPTPSDCAHTSCLTKWICVNPDGTIYPCAKACPPEFAMGNVNDISSLDEAFRSEGFRRILEGSVARREKCMSCPVYRYCNGGCSMDAYHECGLENNGGDSCRIFREVFTHISSEIQRVMDEQEGMSRLNPFVRDALVGKLVNPRVISQRSEGRPFRDRMADPVLDHGLDLLSPASPLIMHSFRTSLTHIPYPWSNWVDSVSDGDDDIGLWRSTGLSMFLSLSDRTREDYSQVASRSDPPSGWMPVRSHRLSIAGAVPLRCHVISRAAGALPSVSRPDSAVMNVQQGAKRVQDRMGDCERTACTMSGDIPKSRMWQYSCARRDACLVYESGTSLPSRS